MWEDNRRGKTSSGLQFAVRFEQSCVQQQEDEFSSRDKDPIPTQILKEKGCSFMDFDAREEAIEFAVALHEENAKKFDTKEANPPCIHDTNEELSRYFFVADEGHRKSWKQTQSKSKNMSGCADVRNGARLLSVRDSMGVPLAAAAPPSDSNAQILDEGPAILEVKEAAKLLKAAKGN
eukprot:4481055-Pyramimonas_sp.AAC.1